MDHAILAPSSAAQWGNCSGSVIAQQHLPNFDTPESKRGTAGHWVASEVLLNFKAEGGERGPLHAGGYVGKVAPNGVVIDDDMCAGAQAFIDEVLRVCQKYGAMRALMVEERVYMPRVHEGCWGTLDAALWIPEQKQLFVFDYKAGMRICDARDNPQLILYAAGLIEKYQINGLEDQQIVLHTVIVQPFAFKPCGPVDVWSVQLSDIHADLNRLHDKAREAFTTPKLSSGPWCRDCRAVKTCSAARMSGYNLYNVADMPYAMDDMTSADMAVERLILRCAIKSAQARLDAIEDDLKARISAGDSSSGLTLEATKGREVWSVAPEQVVAVGRMVGVDLQKIEVPTPAQSRAKVPAAARVMFDAATSKMTTRNSGKTNLIPATDTIVTRAFSKK